MVRAILDGRKTQTRRIVKARKLHPDYGVPIWDEAFVDGKPPEPYLHVPFNGREFGRTVHRHYPKWEVGDMLWVRESLYCDNKGHFGRYKADDAPVGGDLPLVWPWKTKHLSGRFMPKHLTRIWLEITNIRVERVQDINVDDCFAEGVSTQQATHAQPYFTAIWDSLNAKRGYGWDKNPFVWCISFKKIEK